MGKEDMVDPTLRACVDDFMRERNRERAARKSVEEVALQIARECQGHYYLVPKGPAVDALSEVLCRDYGFSRAKDYDTDSCVAFRPDYRNPLVRVLHGIPPFGSAV